MKPTHHTVECWLSPVGLDSTGESFPVELQTGTLGFINYYLDVID